MKTLSPEAITDAHPLLLDVFRDGYGDRYVGDEPFLQSYILAARTAIIDDRHENLNGAALIGPSSRITAAATRTDRETYGSRFQNYVGLLEATHSAVDDAWIGVGEDVKNSIRAAIEQAGMSRSYDEELLINRLERTGRLSNFVIRTSTEGLLISLSDSRHGKQYFQEVWDWTK